MAKTTQTKILVVLTPTLYKVLFTAESDRALREIGEVTFRDMETRLTSEELATLIPGYDCLLGGWGTPRFTDQVLAAADRLQLYMHSAGSIKGALPPAVFDQGIVVTHGAGAIATGVADMCVCLIWMMLRQPHKMDSALKAGKPWNESKEAAIGLAPGALGREMFGQRIGVLGAGHTGRRFIKLVRAMDCEVWVYDPYLSQERAAELGVRKAEMDELLSGCPIVSCHLPTTDETHHMIGARELALLQDGAILTNTARSWVMDQDALLAELQRGRIQAGLDIFDQEPLPEDSPFRALDNVILTPHVAGGTVEARYRQGQFMIDEMRRFLANEPLQFRVTKAMLATMA
jgi:phosphoglycerate dehydrogenase-like enzyme